MLFILNILFYLPLIRPSVSSRITYDPLKVSVEIDIVHLEQLCMMTSIQTRYLIDSDQFFSFFFMTVRVLGV